MYWRKPTILLIVEHRNHLVIGLMDYLCLGQLTQTTPRRSRLILSTMPEFMKSRDETWAEVAEKTWDVVVVGGGITGAGIAREAARRGLSVLLLEQKDFAWGASSRSSKMIHGGLRYLKERQIQLTREAVRAREHLLCEGKGLVEPLRFLYVVYKGDRPGAWTLEFGLTVYDLLKRSRRSYHSQDAMDISLLAPNLNLDGLRGGFVYTDAQTDDARLVFRVLREAVHSGARALNYVKVEGVSQNQRKDRCVLSVRDAEGGNTAELNARFVVSATGAWSGELGLPGEGSLRLRPLRGSHLVFPWDKLPTAQAVTFAHPEDGRPVFAYPWEGVTLVGTTDLDHDKLLSKEPAIAPEETEYLLDALHERFADHNLSTRDLLGTFAGVRPVVFGGHGEPSQEPRELAIHRDGNLVTVAGGKLTTFHSIARKVVQTLSVEPDVSTSLEPIPPEAARAEEVLADLPRLQRSKISGRLGPDLPEFLEWLDENDLEKIQDTPYTWAELKWAFENESVVHLDDLLLRRVRIGHLLPEGGMKLREEIENRLTPHTDWQPRCWREEWRHYSELWRSSYSPAPGNSEER
ncbi:MAG: glycerol-3-phosphate dehydrogenase/oxidase [Rubrobacteraceae bacterium]